VGRREKRRIYPPAFLTRDWVVLHVFQRIYACMGPGRLRARRKEVGAEKLGQGRLALSQLTRQEFREFSLDGNLRWTDASRVCAEATRWLVKFLTELRGPVLESYGRNSVLPPVGRVIPLGGNLLQRESQLRIGLLIRETSPPSLPDFSTAPSSASANICQTRTFNRREVHNRQLTPRVVRDS